MKARDEGEVEYLTGGRTLVVNALRLEKEHHSHQLVDDAVAFSRRLGAKRTYIIHVCHHIGKYEEAQKKLPEGFVLSYDGMVIDV